MAFGHIRGGGFWGVMDVVSACDVAATASDTPGLATFLSVVFSVYIALDSLLAAAVIVRKAGEAEKATVLAIQGGVGDLSTRA
tara:strand:+ start:624 stop:872 length:249 start_codon:yes stop_codon:yes gene_type:complete